MREEYGAIKQTINDNSKPRDIDVVIPNFDEDKDDHQSAKDPDSTT